MTHYAFISDIHANKPAFTAVLDHIDALDAAVDAVICLGDIIGYGPHPAEAVELVQEHADYVVRGNHDRSYNARGKYEHNEMAKAGLRHASNELTNEQKQYLDELPDADVVADGRVLAAHSHPDTENKLDDYVFKNDATTLHPWFKDTGVDIIGVGHTHQAFAVNSRKFHDWAGLTLNPGSVGQPRDGDPRAQYATVDPDTLDVTHHRVEYDIDSVVADIHDAGLPDDTAERLIHGELPNQTRRL